MDRLSHNISTFSSATAVLMGALHRGGASGSTLALMSPSTMLRQQRPLPSPSSLSYGDDQAGDQHIASATDGATGGELALIDDDTQGGTHEDGKAPLSRLPLWRRAHQRTRSFLHTILTSPDYPAQVCVPAYDHNPVGTELLGSGSVPR